LEEPNLHKGYTSYKVELRHHVKYCLEHFGIAHGSLLAHIGLLFVIKEPLYTLNVCAAAPRLNTA